MKFSDIKVGDEITIKAIVTRKDDGQSRHGESIWTTLHGGKWGQHEYRFAPEAVESSITPPSPLKVGDKVRWAHRAHGSPVGELIAIRHGLGWVDWGADYQHVLKNPEIERLVRA